MIPCALHPPKGHPVLVGKIAKPPLLIPDSLLLAVALDDALPASPPVLGIPDPPLTGTVLTDLPVFRFLPHHEASFLYASLSCRRSRNAVRTEIGRQDRRPGARCLPYVGGIGRRARIRTAIL